MGFVDFFRMVMGWWSGTTAEADPVAGRATTWVAEPGGRTWIADKGE